MNVAAFIVLVAALSLNLTACSRDARRPDIKECIAEIQNSLSQGQLTNGPLANETGEERHDAIGTMIAACMEKRGYRHDDGAMTDGRCVDDVDYNPYCYLKSR